MGIITPRFSTARVGGDTRGSRCWRSPRRGCRAWAGLESSSVSSKGHQFNLTGGQWHHSRRGGGGKWRILWLQAGMWAQPLPGGRRVGMSKGNVQTGTDQNSLGKCHGWIQSQEQTQWATPTFCKISQPAEVHNSRFGKKRSEGSCKKHWEKRDWFRTDNWVTGMCNISLKEFPWRKHLLIPRICHLQCQTTLAEELAVKSSPIQPQGSTQAGGEKHERNVTRGCSGSCSELTNGPKQLRSEVS